MDRAALAKLTPAELAEVDDLLSTDPELWRPLPGPQTAACLSEADVTGFGGAGGGGKGLALDTLVPTPNGWTTMGALRVGDTVFADTGEPCRVLAVTEPTLRPCFRLEFDDGTTIVADDVHRWITMTAAERTQALRHSPEWREKRRAKRPSRATGKRGVYVSFVLAMNNAARLMVSKPVDGAMRDTQEIARTVLLKPGASNHSIKVASALTLPERELPIPPYTLGAWLGDGTTLSGDITGLDEGIWQQIRADGFEVRASKKDRMRHCIVGLRTHLRLTGVLGNKHVPAEYLRASMAQRLALLQGLMDTDGHAALDGGCEFDNTNEGLACAVFELAASLGLKPTKLQGTATLHGKAVGPKWRVRWTSALPVFRLERKLARLTGGKRDTNSRRYIVKCEAIESVPTRCIAVDSPSHQYLVTRAMVPTHNSDWIIGQTTTRHRRSIIFRENGTELVGLNNRLRDMLLPRGGIYNGKDSRWTFKRAGGVNCEIELGSFPDMGDEQKYRGRDHDGLYFDEATNMREAQVRFLFAWARTVFPGQRVRIGMTFNPPSTVEGMWLIRFFAPWLDDKHPNPAKPGELRWFATIAGVDIEVPDNRVFVLGDDEKTRIYDFDRTKYLPEDIISPQSRTFIPSRVTDNPFLGATYMRQLQALPEPLRSQMLKGDFRAGMKDDAYQVIATAHVDAAMARWKKPDKIPVMDSMGVDVALAGVMGQGRDEHVIMTRHGMWFAEPIAHEAKSVTDGSVSGSLVVAAWRDQAVIHVDLFGVGAMTYAFLIGLQLQALGINFGDKVPNALDQTGKLRFSDLRSYLWWKMREVLDPMNNTGIALPPSTRLRADLCTPKWSFAGQTIKVQSREEIVKKLGRSPDYGTAAILALIDTPKRSNLVALLKAGAKHPEGHGHDPFMIFEDRTP